MNNILAATIALGSIGLVLGILLAVASKVLAIETDERLEKISEILPGANCGACGFAGCNAFASAVINGDVSPSGCPVGGEQLINQISEILGVAVDTRKKVVAHVNCSGGDAILRRFQYVGVESCYAAARVGGGPTECTFACLGFGDCIKACGFGAIRIERGHAVVDREKCTGCGLCAGACPRKIIEIIPEESVYSVSCSSRDRGNITRTVCDYGCIGCLLCVKKCAHEAIIVKDNLARIDYSLCVGCGDCVSVCPRGIIRVAKEV
ncbi:MAG: Fe-S cluster domain-containing protein [Clostridiales bacterium]|nr:Fe-S cluster domain-containing protein [Clostridiales bacterium]